jgi:hypothetical protein
MSNYPCITVQAGARDGNNVRGEPGAGFRHNNRDVHDVVVPDFPYALKPFPTICASALAAMAKQNRFGPARAVLFTATFDVHLHPIREYGGFRDDLITVALAEDTGVNFAQFVRRDMNVLNVDPGNIIAAPRQRFFLSFQLYAIPSMDLCQGILKGGGGDRDREGVSDIRKMQGHIVLFHDISPFFNAAF